MKEIYTNWTEATNNPNKAIIGLVSCLESGEMLGLKLERMGSRIFR